MTTLSHPLVARALRGLDVVFAAGIFAFGTYEALTRDPRGGIGPNVVVAAALALLVLRRKAWPAIPVAAAWTAIVVVQGLVFATASDTSVGWLAFLLLVYAFGRHVAGRDAVVALVVAVVGMVLLYALYDDHVPGDFFYPEAIGTVVWLAGRTLRGRARLTEQLHEVAVLAQERVEREAAHAQAEERRRLAQEMHDVIAHSLSLIVVQAGGARRILQQDPGRAAQAAGLIEQTGRETLGELRQLLGVLGTGLNHTSGPAPSLGRLDELVATADAAGLQVTLRRTGDGAELPAGVDLAAYRIVQEALTNALRHAGPVATSVHVHQGGGLVELTIENAPGEATRAALGSSGHGLVGMTERTNLYGGTLDAAPTAGGGFRVAATLRHDRSEVTA